MLAPARNPFWFERRRTITAALRFEADELDQAIRAFRNRLSEVERSLSEVPRATMLSSRLRDDLADLTLMAAELVARPEALRANLSEGVRAFQREAAAATTEAQLEAAWTRRQQLLDGVAVRLAEAETGPRLPGYSLPLIAVMLVLVLLVPRLYPREIQHRLIGSGLLVQLGLAFLLASLVLLGIAGSLPLLPLAALVVAGAFLLGYLGGRRGSALRMAEGSPWTESDPALVAGAKDQPALRASGSEPLTDRSS